MAAGRHGGYRDNELRDRESNMYVSKRDLGYSKEECDRSGSSNHDGEQVRSRNARDSARVRQKDVKEREVANGAYHSFSSRSDSGSSGGGGAGAGGSRHRGISVRTMDREPGELSSESGSDDAIESDTQVKDIEVFKTAENGTHSPVVEKKRKFSPIIWDRDDDESSRAVKRRASTTVTALPPPPPLPKSYREIPNTHNGVVQISSVKSDLGQEPQSSSPVTENVNLSGESGADSPLGLSSAFALPSDGNPWGNDQEATQLEDEDYVPMRNISSSRWAAGDSSPVDEGEIVEDEDLPKRRKKTPLLESLGIRGRGKSVSPELGKLKKDGSDGLSGRSSEPDGRGGAAGSSSDNRYSDHDSDKNDYMDVDEKNRHDDMINDMSETNSESDDDSRGTPEPACPPQRSVNMLQGCRSVDEFERLNKIDEGTYGVVYRARDKKTGEIVALKKVKMEKEREGFPLTSLREINILLAFHHPSIVDVKEVVVGSNLDSIFMVMEYMEHDLKGLMETMKQPFSQSEVKCLMLQLLEGVKYLHDNWVLHRDLKTSNLLLNNRGELKICDFGLARQYGSPLKPYTHLVVTLWYRAPELLLGAKQYSTAIDMWSLGCIMAEMLSKEPLFNGKTEFDQLDKIFRTLGTPNETIWPGFSKLPGVKVNFVKHQLPALGDSGTTCCGRNFHQHLSQDPQYFQILVLTC
ncbi:cyclin-dependent kinase G-2 isoform X2 [Rhodamnia argentea]|uniref:cyclin-dependent kinase n=1 Tax=Rhodamnia argentea TaxID=178133 RepID=A0A8B8Q6Q4_9MYRT|nr:cyclin-dependent kinase G-2 isoform X2 [Rhodamnia argentea]